MAIMKHGKPSFYCVPAELYVAMLDAIEDCELCSIHRLISQPITAVRNLWVPQNNQNMHALIHFDYLEFPSDFAIKH